MEATGQGAARAKTFPLAVLLLARVGCTNYFAGPSWCYQCAGHITDSNPVMLTFRQVSGEERVSGQPLGHASYHLCSALCHTLYYTLDND